MTPAAKAVYLGALLIGLALGAFVGFRVEGSFLGLDYEGRRSLAPAALVDFSNMQYSHADVEHAESALQMTAAFLENMEELKPEKAQKLDLAMAYTRLALLQDAASNSQQSHAYMVKARSWYKASGGQDYPESEMKARLRAFDQRNEEGAGSH
jgi:hypothetical protein